MFAYTVRRTIYMMPIFFGIALLLFLLFNVAGGDPAVLMLGKHANAQAIAELRAELGLDQPLPMQFLNNFVQMITFDFGRSYTTRQQIISMIGEAAPVSLSLMLPAFVITTLLAISIGLLVAFFRGTWIDRFAVVLSVMGISIPVLAYILFGQYFFAYEMGWFPISGYSRYFPDAIFYLALPALLYVVSTLGYDVRFYRTVMLDEIYKDYIRTARAKGLSERVILFKHLLKNAMIPIITLIVLQIPFLITGSLLLENFFGIPGMGSMLIDALNSADFPVVKAIVTILAIAYMFFTLLTDILYAVVDPRISLK